MKLSSFILVFLTFFLCCLSIAKIENFSNVKIQKVYENFSIGEYEKVLEQINELEKNPNEIKDIVNPLGLLKYWKGLSYARMNEYPLALENFKASVKLKYIPQDLFYEYGQALYVSEKLLAARIAFKKSVEKKYKTAVSLYYIAFISQTLKDYNKASSFYQAIEALPDEEKQEVVQAARMQLGDIYWEKVKQRPNIYASLTKYVIPQYENALAWDDESTLAPKIQQKINELKRKYDIELFQMRNGRNTARPPYFLKVNALYGNNDNVNILDKDSIETATDDVGSNYQTFGFFGRYSFYPSSAFSIAPELFVNSTKYSSENSDIFANDNYTITTALKMNYEKNFNNAPATTYIDIGYTTNSNDANADKKMESNFTSTSISISEERQFILNNPTIFRLKYTDTKDVTESESFNVSSFVWEQLVSYGNFTFYFFSSYDLTRFPESEESDTDGYILRGDFIFPTFFNLFNPILYASTNQAKYVNNDSRGTTNLSTLGVSLNRPVGKNWYITLDYSDSSQSAELDSDIYQQKVMSINLDYIY